MQNIFSNTSILACNDARWSGVVGYITTVGAGIVTCGGTQLV